MDYITLNPVMKSSCSNTDTLKILRLLWNTAIVTGNEFIQAAEQAIIYNIIKFIERGEFSDSKKPGIYMYMYDFKHLLSSSSSHYFKFDRKFKRAIS